MFMGGKLESTDEQKKENRDFHSTAQENSYQHVGVFPSMWFLEQRNHYKVMYLEHQYQT